jgi:beta-lactam-binding protein with PASTA domain
MPLTKAEQLLKERGLQLRVVRWQPSKDIPPNHILRMEDPEPNRRVLEGREVLVVVSQGVAPVLVPDVTGQKLEDALATLKGAHLKVGQKVETFSETRPRWHGRRSATAPPHPSPRRHTRQLDRQQRSAPT